MEFQLIESNKGGNFLVIDKFRSKGDNKHACVSYNLSIRLVDNQVVIKGSIQHDHPNHQRTIEKQILVNSAKVCILNNLAAKTRSSYPSSLRDNIDLVGSASIR